ncbi:MAG: cytidine deaminase [Aestuariivita sp.]|nr:cytidine deaminase [Aestuariivita sp.]
MTLRQAAKVVQKRSYAPYSKFRVGAAIKTDSGAIYLGCNVENVAYPEGTCAEAGAIAAMVAAGETEIAEVYVIADGLTPVTPCGGCRQKLAEFSHGEVIVTMGTVENDEEVRTRLSDLLPGAFGINHMIKND